MHHRYNPAVTLERINEQYMSKKRELLPYQGKASELANGNAIKYNLLLTSDPEAVEILKDIERLGEEYDLELIAVKNIYLELFKTHFITINEIEEMIDLNYKYLNRNVLQNVSTIYFSRLVRQDVKYYRRSKKPDGLEVMLYKNQIDIDKSLFISYNDLRKWIKDHTFTKDGDKLKETLVDKLLTVDRENVSDNSTTGKRKSTLVGTETYKAMFNMKYDMQLKRALKERVYIFSQYGAKPISRIPLSSQMQDILKNKN